MAKPFSIQSPEDIAKEYAGNKQRIAQAMQLGVVNPTAGVLAGMFIDRMRSAQMQEAVAPPTVAQQVMGGVPPAPPVPTPPAGGLGATPQAAPPMAPMAPPMPAPGGAPMGMADGGLVGIPVPETMFDEPDNGGYAGGGLVAFAAGGSPGERMTDEEYLAYILQKESGGRDYDKQGRPLTSSAGAKYAMQVRDATARNPGYGVKPAKADTAEEYNRVGREYALALRKKYGDEGGAAAYNMGPGAYEAYRAGRRAMPKETQNYIAGLGSAAPIQSATAAPQSLPGNAPDILAQAGRFREALSGTTAPKTARRDEMIAELEASLSPEARKEERSQRMWEALSQFGFQLAQTPGSLLQAASTAASKTLPTLQAGDKQAKAQLRADRAALVSLEDKANDEKQELELLALELAKAQAGLLSDERKMDLQYQIAKMDDRTRRALTAMSNYAQVYTSVYGDVMGYRSQMDRPRTTTGTAFGIPPVGVTTEGGAAQPIVLEPM